MNSVHFPADMMVGFAAASNGAVIWTSDGGENWKALSLGMAVPPILSIHFRHDTITGYAVGAGGALFKTVDGGTNWQRLDSRTTGDLHAVRFFDDANRGIIAGQNGTILVSEYAGFDWGKPQEIRNAD